MNNLNNCSGFQFRKSGTGRHLPECLVLATICVSMLYSCGASREEMEYKEKQMQIADSLSRQLQGLATDTIDGVTHNFIRTAEIKMSVLNVHETSRKIEDLVNHSGGYIADNNLTSEEETHLKINFKPDSVKHIRHFTTRSLLTLKVPNKQLDSVLRKISTMAQFIDFNRLKADDVKMKLYAATLSEQRYKQYKQRIEKKSDANQLKLNHTLTAEESALDKQMAADAKRIETYELAEKVNYSTLNIELYQAPSSFCETYYIASTPEQYQASFGDKLSASFINGFKTIEDFILFLSRSWGVIFILLVAGLCVRKIINTFNKQLPDQGQQTKQ